MPAALLPTLLLLLLLLLLVARAFTATSNRKWGTGGAKYCNTNHGKYNWSVFSHPHGPTERRVLCC
jgi:hypothetical protein